LFLVFIFRIVYIYICPLQLVPDEAYYWDWSRHLDIGYFSKPPLIAWLNYISTYILGINEIGVRFFAALFGTGSIGIIYLLGKRMFNEEIAIWAAAMCMLTPANAALSFIMTIDSPLVFFGSLTILFLWEAIISQEKRVCGSRPLDWRWQQPHHLQASVAQHHRPPVGS
jgi:undecaprenyl-diphosphatase